MVGPSATSGMGGLEIGPLSLGGHKPPQTQNFVGPVVEALRGDQDFKDSGGPCWAFCSCSPKVF